MYQSVSVKKIANGFLMEYQHWLDHLPNRYVFVPSTDMASHANLIEGLMTFEEATVLAQKSRAPEQKKPVKKESVAVEGDDDL